MLRTDKPIYKVILVFNLLLIAAAVALSVIGICGEVATAIRIISTVIRLLALLYAGFYILSGYRKDAAKYFKIFGILYLFSTVLGLISCISNTPTVLSVIFYVLSIIAILALAFAKDLGKAKSFVLCGILVALQIALSVSVYLQADPAIVKINMFISMDLACLFGIMTYAKYLDKTERGTK